MQSPCEIGVRGPLYSRCYAGIGRAAVRGVVLEAAILGRVVGRCDDDPIRETGVAVPVVGQDRMRNDRGRGVAAPGTNPALGIDHYIDIVRGKYLQRAGQSGFGQSVGIDADEQRAGDAGATAVIRDGLTDRQDMVFVEGVIEGGPAMAGGAERDALRWHRRVRLAGEVGCHQTRQVDQLRCIKGLARVGVYCVGQSRSPFEGGC